MSPRKWVAVVVWVQARALVGVSRRRVRSRAPYYSSSPQLVTVEVAVGDGEFAAALGELALRAVLDCGDELAGVLGSSDDVYVKDGLLGERMCRALRGEAEACREAGLMEVAASSGDVRSTIVSEEEAPLLSAYASSVAQGLTTVFNETVTAEGATHKLAVAEATGAAYARHIDTARGEQVDRRKLTAIYYLNPDYEPHLGGSFRTFGASSTSVEPRGDRLVVFWADTLVHDVAASTLIEGKEQHRWALTVWLRALEGVAIASPCAELEDFHFGAGARDRYLSQVGDREAQFQLGECFFNGRGSFDRDEGASMDWYRKAAEQGHAKAAFSLGCALLDDDMGQARRYFRIAAEQNHPRAAYNLARALDDYESMAWFKRAADLGFAPAQTEYASRSSAIEVKVKYLRLAVRQGHQPAYPLLADLIHQEG